MKTTKRFDQAVNKLYTAFHNNSLQPDSCRRCAVGTILDNNDAWRHLSDEHGSLQLNYVGHVNQNLGKRFNGYSPLELLEIEMEFLKNCGYTLPIEQNKNQPKKIKKKVLFKGLEAVVAKLCQFDQIPNVMDCSKLFAYEIKKKQTKSIEYSSSY